MDSQLKTPSVPEGQRENQLLGCSRFTGGRSSYPNPSANLVGVRRAFAVLKGFGISISFYSGIPFVTPLVWSGF